MKPHEIRHVFLTGEVGVGKSTALRTFIEASGLVPAGLMTVFGPADETGAENLYLLPWSADPAAAAANAVRCGVRPAGSRNRRECIAQRFPEVFDSLGVELVRAACESVKRGSADIVVLDELGFLETDAKRFRSEVLRLLDDPRIAIAGVVKEKTLPFTDAIKKHEFTTVLMVTRENRAGSAWEVLRIFKAGRKSREVPHDGNTG
jgi:nucleoside-triphosphatase